MTAMASRSRAPDPAAWVVIALLIAGQVAGKAIRDAFFFSEFRASALPAMTMITAVASLASVLVFSRLLAAHGPRRMLVGTLAASGAALVVTGLAAGALPRPAAVAVYLIGSIAPPLAISGFWALVTERFDVRAVRRSSVGLGGAGTLGGVVAGVVTMAIAARAVVGVSLPAWGALQLLTASVAPLIARGTVAPARGEAIDALDGVRRLMRHEYVGAIALLVVLGATSAALLDYAFKRELTHHVAGNGRLLRAFSWFYTAASALAFVLQIALARRALARFGPAGTAAILPGSVVTFGAVALVVPGTATVVLARVAELVTRNSVFRSGYELLYGPVSAAERRSTKPLVDVGGERVGDMLGGAGAQALVGLGPWSGPAALASAVFVAAVGAVMAWRLRGRYVRQLETGLAARTPEGAPLLGDDLSMSISIEGLQRAPDSPESIATDVLAPGMDWIGEARLAPRSEPAAAEPATLDDDVRTLRAGAMPEVVAVLARRQPLPAALMPAALPLLARNAIAPLLLEALGTPDPAGLAALAAFMRDPGHDVQARRRVPRVIARSDEPAAAEVLFQGLRDPRFEMRVQCGRALLKLKERRGVAWDPARVLPAVEREVAVERHIWETQQASARDDWGRDAALLDRVIRARASASLAHVFTLLALVLPREPVERALAGLESDDAIRRGLALEYLESVLPPSIREKLWPFLERESVARTAPAPKPIEQILADHESMVISVEELRRLRENLPPAPPPGAPADPGPTTSRPDPS